MNPKVGIVALAAFGVAMSCAFRPSLPRTSKRQLVVDFAMGELDSDDAEKYWLDTLGPGSHPKDWCGAFALWALHQAGLALDVGWKIGRGFLMVPPHALPMTNQPQEGDIAYFNKSQHHAVVVGVGYESVALINGNGAGGVVTATSVPLSSVTAFFSIQPYLDNA